MAPVPVSVHANQKVRLRVWFESGSIAWAATLVTVLHVAFLFHTADVRAGRVLGPGLWLVGLGLLHVASLPLLLHLSSLVFGIWLTTAALHHRHVLGVLALTALFALAGAAGVWGLTETGSVAIGIWSGFLVLAIATFIPHPQARASSPSLGGFQERARSAEQALSQINAR